MGDEDDMVDFIVDEEEVDEIGVFIRYKFVVIFLWFCLDLRILLLIFIDCMQT